MTLIPPAYECPTVHPCDTMRHDNELVPYPEKVKANFRAGRDWQLDDDFEYAPEELDRSVQTPDQIRTIARTLRDRWQSDLFPQRQELPKTLVFAKGDAWRHERITLNPVNPDFEPIVLTGRDEGELQVIAELVEVLRSEE